MSGMLDLTSGVESSFDPLPPGKYICEVHSMEMVETASDGKVPKGTPMMKVRLTVISTKEGETEVTDNDGTVFQLEGMNRTTFMNLVIPPEDHDPKKANTLKGNIISFFKAVGIPEEELRKPKGYNPDMDAFDGMRLEATLGRDPKYSSNPVRGVKPLEEGQPAGLL
jgi:hypothetical protein